MGTTKSKPPGLFIRIDQSKILNRSPVQFITLFCGGAQLCCAFYQARQAARIWCKKTNSLLFSPHLGFSPTWHFPKDWRQGFFVFFFSIFWCSWSDDFARFGYRLNMKVEKKKAGSSFYILGYLLELIIKIWWFGNFFFSRNLANLGHFFSWKILRIGQKHIFQVKIWRNFTKKKEEALKSGGELVLQPLTLIRVS